MAPNWEDPQGVPISGLIFGSRRTQVVPLVFEAFDWAHGVFLGSAMSTETTAAITGQVGVVRRDPMAMIPFCGYNMADYFAHWLGMGPRLAKPPRIFRVNWFRRDADGRFLWPGYGENMRILKWMVERIRGGGRATETPIGSMPAPGALELDGLDVTPTRLAEALRCDARRVARRPRRPRPVLRPVRPAPPRPHRHDPDRDAPPLRRLTRRPLAPPTIEERPGPPGTTSAGAWGPVRGPPLKRDRRRCGGRGTRGPWSRRSGGG